MLNCWLYSVDRTSKAGRHCQVCVYRYDENKNTNSILTLSRLNIPEAFLKASDFPKSSSLARVASRWLLAHSPIPMATPWETHYPKHTLLAQFNGHFSLLWPNSTSRLSLTPALQFDNHSLLGLKTKNTTIPNHLVKIQRKWGGNLTPDTNYSLGRQTWPPFENKQRHKTTCHKTVLTGQFSCTKNPCSARRRSALPYADNYITGHAEHMMINKSKCYQEDHGLTQTGTKRFYRSLDGVVVSCTDQYLLELLLDHLLIGTLLQGHSNAPVEETLWKEPWSQEEKPW